MAKLVTVEEKQGLDNAQRVRFNTVFSVIYWQTYHSFRFIAQSNESMCEE